MRFEACSRGEVTLTALLEEGVLLKLDRFSRLDRERFFSGVD